MLDYFVVLFYLGKFIGSDNYVVIDDFKLVVNVVFIL